MSLIQKVFLLLASVSGAMSVILGAMGAHYLKDKINYWEMNAFDTGVKYQMYHTLALLALVLMMNKWQSNWLTYAGYAFILGLCLFCGSLYLLSIKEVFYVPGTKFLGPVTPIGGLAFISGWIFLVIFVISNWKQLDV